VRLSGTESGRSPIDGPLSPRQTRGMPFPPTGSILHGRLGRLSPGWALFLLAPILGELVSGHQAPLEFVNPITWVLTAAPYGLGALAARELVVRWGKGWWSLLLLGIAYGLFEEGIVARSLFDGRWSELGSLADYDFAGGINWTYAQLLLHFHATISILASVALVGLLYPTRRREPWISNRSLGLCGVGLALWAPALMGVQALVDDPEWPLFFPSLALYLGTMGAIAGLVVLARTLPVGNPPPHDRTVPRPLAFGLVGAVNTTIVFLVVFAVPEWDSPPPLAASVAFIATFDAASVAVLARWSGNFHAWGETHVFALVAGQLAFFLVFGVLADFTDGWTGTSLVSIAAVYLLSKMWAIIRPRDRETLVPMPVC
jgi:hypothetical protein